MTIRYLFRYRLKHYHSIEELFKNIISQVALTCNTNSTELSQTGASLNVLYQNIKQYNASTEDLVHITGDVHYMALSTRQKTVLTIHDVNSAYHGSLIKRLYILLFWFWLPAIRVHRITVISEFTKAQLSKIIPFAKQKIRVIHNPVHPELRYSPKIIASEKPLVLLIGTKSNKNLERSLEAMKDLHCKVLIIGVLSTSQYDSLEAFDIDYENVYHLSFEEVVHCYKRSDLLCYPSLYEGFGMPIIEAQAIGRPVITSNIGAMKEIAADSASLVDPYNVDAIRSAIQHIITNTHYREQLVVAGLENVKRFQLEKIAADYITVYNELISS